MGFLSSLFDFGDKPTTTSGGQTMTPVIPEMLKANVQEVVDASQSLYKQRLGEGYKPYTGQTIAGFSPEEVAAQEGLKSLVGTQAPLQQEAINMARGQAREFTPETAQQYMSPYLRTALDAQKAQAQRQYESIKQPEFEASAVAAGGMSGLGSRAAVQAAEMDSNQQRMLADIEAIGQQKAFEAAEQSFRDQTSRERTAGQDLLRGSAEAFAGGVKEQGLLTVIGEQKRDLSQSALDEAYLKYVTEQQFPEQQLARYQSSIYGNPLLAQPSYNKTTTGTEAGGGPGLGKTLLGMAGTAVGIGKYMGLSDERVKTDITPIGMDDSTGLQMFAYRYKGDPKSYPKVVGPIAQDVEQKYPEAVGEVNGFKTIDMGMLQNNGIAGTPEGQEYIERSAAMGGPVMPPVMYRQENGKVMPPPLSIQEKINEINTQRGRISLDKVKGIDKFKEQDMKARDQTVGDTVKEIFNLTPTSQVDEPGDPKGGGQANFQPNTVGGLSTLSDKGPSMSDDDRYKAMEKRRNEDLSILNVSKSKPGDAGADPDETQIPSLPETNEAKKNIAERYMELTNKFINDQRANLQSTEQQDALTVAGKKLRKDNQDLFNKYNDRITKLIGDDPNAEAKFWLTIGATIMKPGNAFANMAEGIRLAIANSDADRVEKNKLLAELSKDELKFEQNINDFKYKENVAGIKLTASQKDAISKLPKTEADMLLKLLSAQTLSNTQKAALINAKTKADKGKILKIPDTKTLTKNFSNKLNQLSSKWFIDGKPRNKKASKWFNNVDRTFQDIYADPRFGRSKAVEWLTKKIDNDRDNFNTMFGGKED